MKRRLSSFITAMFVLMICVFASACGDRYKNLEFKVYYAFSADATEWIDGTNGISLNYDPDEIYVGGERTSLIFDENGNATLFVKVEIENVKSKYVDSITISSANSILNSKTVKEGEVVGIPIRKDGNDNANLNTTFKLYENNSGKKHNLPFVVSRELKGIVANKTLKPAVYTNGSLNLLRLNNLTYEPAGQTNQLGVTYSIDSIGRYVEENYKRVYKEEILGEAAQEYFYVENLADGILKVKNGEFISTGYIVRIKATSVFHDGSVEGEKPIADEFDVYVVEGNITNPVVKFDNVDGKVIESQINIYENGVIYNAKDEIVANYATSTMFVDSSTLTNKTVYADNGVFTDNGSISYAPVVYVINQSGKYEKYDLEDANYQSGINGLCVNIVDGNFVFSIADRNVQRNSIKVRYELKGLDFSCSDAPNINADGVGTKIDVVKGVVPTCITVNDTLDLDNSSQTQSATVYGTTSADYKGLRLKFSATPNNNLSKTISFEDVNSGLLITNSKGAAVSEIVDSSVVYIKFKDNVTEKQTLVIKTLKAPTYYNEKNISNIVVNDDLSYITIKYELEKLVTADKFVFIDNPASVDSIDSKLVDAKNGSNAYVKVYYTGVYLDSTTIKLTSDNENILFENGLTEITLSDVKYLSTDTDAVGKFNVYEIPVKTTNSLATANISIVAGDGTLGVDETLKVSSVHLMPVGADENIDINAKTANVKEFSKAEVNNNSFNFAISKGEFAEFVVLDGLGNTNAFTKLELSTVEEAGEHFSKNAINYNGISSSVFVVNGRVGGKTQILSVKAYYYALEMDKVVLKNKELTVQIAVYEPIGNIQVDSYVDTIGYVNPYFTETNSTHIAFSSYTATYGTPASSVFFKDVANGVSGASQISVAVNNYRSILPFYDGLDLVSIKFVSSDKEINLLETSSTVLTLNEEDFLNGTIIASVHGDVSGLNEISLTLTALRFGRTSNVLSNVVVKIASVDKAQKILVSGEEFVETSDTEKELRMSFKNVKDGQYDETSFTANLQFETQNAAANVLRFDNISNALTHMLYKYSLDADGKFIYTTNANGETVPVRTRIQDDFFDVIYNSNGIVTIRAYKDFGGGLFKLVLATKDSYKGLLDPSKNEIYEEDFATTFAITIRVSDGEIGSEYLIETVDDLLTINYNLSKNFKLVANLGIQNVVNIKPIGLVDGSVAEFTGRLNGEFETFVEGEKTKVSTYSINLMVKDVVETDQYGMLAGLFAVVGQNAKIENLKLNVTLSSSFESKVVNGLKLGALAGVNKGVINNVNVDMLLNSTDLTGVTAGHTDFGGIVGLNEGEINSSKTINLQNLSICSAISQQYNIGLIAGTNKGTIKGNYLGKDSLNSFVYDVYANLTITNQSLNSAAKYNVGGVAGVNNGEISSMLVGGNIFVTNIVNAQEEGYIGGIAGISLEENNSIKLSTVMALDITNDETNLALGGIVGYANATTIDTVKFVSAKVENDGIITKGQIEGLVVGGIVAKAENGSIKYASVESFVLKEDDGTTDLYTLKGTTVGGLVALTSGTIVENSFVHANVSASEKLILTTEESETNTYFIGKLNKPFVVGTDVNNATYAILDNSIYKGTEAQTIAWSTIMVEDNTISATTKDWENVYIKNADGTYSKATSFDEDETYFKLDVEKWIEFAKGLTTWNASWEIEEYYNVVNINGVDLFFPYLLRSYKDAEDKDKIEKLMIVEPKSISASINTNYVAKQNSTYVSKFNFTFNEIKITESVIVNFFNGATAEENTHRLINNPKIYNNGLLDASIIPEDAQGGLAFEIMGDGYNYAYINDSVYKSIVFTKASGSTPIIVRVYSVFNREIELYVAFYTQSLATDLIINSNATYESGEAAYDYEINLFTGQSNKIMSIDALNKKNGKDYLSLFDVYEISQYIVIEEEIEAETKLDLTVSSYQNISIKIQENLADDKKITSGEFEVVKFKVYLRTDYFNLAATENTLIDELTLKVNLYNSASNIVTDKDYVEVTTNDDINFEVRLTTDFVEKTKFGVEEEFVDLTTGEISFDATDGHGVTIRDSIIIGIDVVDGLAEFETLKANINATIENENDKIVHFSELFNVTIISGLLKTNDGNKILGYTYDVLLELKNGNICKCGEHHEYGYNGHIYKFIEENIKFSIYVRASSNSNVNNDNSPIEILLKPTTLSTARIENYVVNTLDTYTDYTKIVANDDVETSLIEPGKLGNVMMIYLEPTYSYVKSAKIKTSELYVPSLGKNVKMMFTQLVHDKRRFNDGAFTTIYGGNVQQDDTLELQLVSRIDETGNRIYDGVIFVYIQVERFSGLEATITAELEVETNNGKIISRSRDLLTSYLPGTEIKYDENKAVNEGYLIQKGTSNNEVQIKIYGYQFNSDPTITFDWVLPTRDDGHGNLVPTGDFVYDGDSRKIIVKEGKKYLIGDYISYVFNNNYTEITYNENDDSYTLSLKLNVSEDIPASFKVNAGLSLITKDGQLKEQSDTILFYPTDYVLNSVSVNNLVNERMNISINKTKKLEFNFETDSEINNFSELIYSSLLTYVQGFANVEEKLASMFSYYKNGEVVTFADNHPEFYFNFVNNNSMSITGVSKFNNLIQFNIMYGYDLDDNGVYTLKFGESANYHKATPLNCTFTLNVYVVNEENEILINSAEELYDSTTHTWELVEGGHYVLMNDITLENVVPITTKIGSFDGNNRVISIKNFVVDPKTSQFGLFASIGTYSVEDLEENKTYQKQTLLKNMIVDYSKFEGTLALNNLESKNVTFGGLVAENDGGLIYNCDVMNLNSATDAQIDIIVSATSNLTFGGLVGTNNGNITNSRVGRDSYTRIIATRTTESSMEVVAGGLSFSVYNRENDNDDVNQFAVVAGGFVGVNSGIISSSYVENTNLYNYSTNETTNMSAGFVGKNTKTISYSYVKADDDTITNINAKATGYEVESKGNGIVAGFVYENSGEINNAYSNLELQTKSAYIAGFVYKNTGKISETYAATTMNSGDLDTNAEQPFVGIDNAGNLLSHGSIENSYYLMRSGIDTPYTQGDLDVAQGLNLDNFQNNEYLIGFAFVLSNSKADREQGIWSYYTLDSKKRMLPELVTANVVAHSHRFIVDENAANKVLTNAMSYEKGSANNPYIISSVEDYNNVFTMDNTTNNLVGYVRFVNNINFNDDKTAIKTRANYVLGSQNIASKTSIEGNGMTISGIYLDVGEAIVEKIGLFAEIQNAYVKNLNLQFATPTTDGQFSTTTANYSGGLAGLIKNSAILNIKLSGTNTTLTGSNFVGGVAGLISGNSLIYGIETSLNVKTSGTESFLYYSREDYQNLNIKQTSFYDYDEYLKHMSYAGGVAGVLDLTKRSNIDYNVQFVDVRGDQMSAKTFEGKQEANIIAEYAGGVAGYANEETQSFKVRYFVGTSERIKGNTAVGGLYGVNLGGITASQVAAEEDIQFNNDTTIGSYIQELQTKQDAKLNTASAGNLKLLEGYNYVGGLVGVALNSNIRASYSKASIVSGKVVGGLVGVSVSSVINYSYAIPYINIAENLNSVGGLIGSAYGIVATTPERNSEIATYEKLLKSKGVANKNTDIQFTYSTLIMENSELKNVGNQVVLDYVCANYADIDRNYLQSNANTNFVYVYAGTVNYYKVSEEVLVVQNNTRATNKASVMELHKLYKVGDPAQVISFQEVFSGWSLMKYWSLKEEKYFPLLNNEGVDNFIDIDDEADFEQIASNPNGKFRVVKDITIATKTANWIVSGSGYSAFAGVMIGEIEGDSRRPTITIQGLKPNFANETSGFFQETRNATISNLAFEWTETNLSAINMVNVSSLTMVSGLTCKDTNSLISNVEVRVAGGNGVMINTGENKTISGFGGIVGESTNTNILGSRFVGKIDATIKGSNKIANNKATVGGLVGYALTDAKQGNADTSSSVVINNASFGVSRESANDDNTSVKYPTSSITLRVSTENKSPIYVGGTIGYADNVGIASNNVGGIAYHEGYSAVNFEVNVTNLTNNLHLGGIAGYASDGLISNSEAVTNINVIGTLSNGEQTLNVGGLVGELKLPTSTIGVSSCQTKSVITSGDILQTSVSDQVNISAGIAVLGAGSRVSQCLFTGSVNTEGANIGQLYAGGAFAQSTSKDDDVVVSEITTYVDLYVGCEENEEGIGGTIKLFVGGLIGYAKNIKISYSVAWGIIVPITSSKATDIYAGGLIGKVEISANVNNSYTTSSIIADSIAGTALKKLNMGALVGEIPEGNINFTSVFYSSDYALFADENYVTNEEGDRLPLGSNISAKAMIMGNLWQTELKTEDGENSIWTSLEVGNDTRLPYLSSLEERLIEFDILGRESGALTFDYTEGTVMRPRIISSGDGSTCSFNEEKFTYYLLIKGSGSLTPKFTGVLNGILMGQDLKIEETFTMGEINSVAVQSQSGSTFKGIIPAVGKHSAVSNLHVVVDGEIDETGTYGIITGLNEGVVFNSSVQGNGIKFTGSGNAGLISGQNEGMISYCFSTAEIVEGSAQLGGIVHTNNGKLLSNYFTGYIGTSSKSAGVVVTSNGDNSYAYNNYMAGVVKNISGNAFGAVTKEKASNNFIDTYSDFEYSGKEKEGLDSVFTAELMSKARLDGEWYTTVENRMFKGISGASVNPELTHFGNNYNYPVYRFNKLMVSGDIFIVDDTKNQLYTGTGGTSAALISDNASLETRYSNVVENTTQYYHAFKIPHLGVLSSIQALLGNSGNYVVIYDIDGEYEENSFIPWKAIGNDGFNGFAGTVKSFNGLFMTNRNYAHTEENNICKIENLQDNGLFNTIDKAYFAKIDLGSFHNLSNSGAIGKTIINQNQAVVAAEEPVQQTGYDVTINFVSFLENSVVSGVNGATNYFGGLFGEVQSKLEILSFATANGTGATAKANVRLKGLDSTTGLIAGKLSSDGEINLPTSGGQIYHAWFDGNSYAGGLVGEINGGTIEGNGNIINITHSTFVGASQVYDVAHANIVGGVVGKVSNNATIKNVTVNIYRPSNNEIEIKANGFGGIVGEVQGKTEIEQCVITTSDANGKITFHGNSKNNRYFGLVAALQTNGVMEVTVLKIENIKEVSINGTESDFDENTENSGVGTLIGSIKGDSSESNVEFECGEIILNVAGIPNLGGLVGYFNGKTISVNSLNNAQQAKSGENTFKTILHGTTNVGGVIGYLNDNIDASTIKGVTNLGSFSTLELKWENDTNIRKNFGGLFGKWTGSNKLQDEEYLNLTNNNLIKASKLGEFYNVGGIAGKLSAGEPINVGNLTNFGAISVDNNYSLNAIKSGSGNEETTKLVNVGGIFGQIEANYAVSLTQVINSDVQINGYQNIGGVVGFINSKGNGVTIKNPASIEVEGGLTLTYDDEKEEVVSSGGTILDKPATGNEQLFTSGEIYGVINVGGVAGYAGPATEISQVHARANVYGNASVGGLIGLTEKATLTNNYLDYNEEDTAKGVVKGIYYTYQYKVGNKDAEDYSFIPTSVGGIVGTAAETTMNNNIVDAVRVTSTPESEEGDVINTNENCMFKIVVGEGNSVISNYTNAESAYKITLAEISTDKLKYADIESGYGGFVGTLDSATMGAQIENNSIKDVEVNAQLGINVGAYYGVYKFSKLFGTEEENIVMIMPKYFGENNSVNGSYNVGGIAGFVAGDVGSAEFKLTNANLKGKGTINVQDKFSGFYIGGLLGKTSSNQVKGLNIVSGANVKVGIKLYTNSNYYVGGLIGRAEVSGNATIEGNVGEWKMNTQNTPETEDDVMSMTDNSAQIIANEHDDKRNFGGLIGILEVGESRNGLTVTVSGKHKFAFTINTIENVNYHDGDSRFSSQTDDRGHVLYAEAYYVNKDHFNIEGSSNTDLYEYKPGSTTVNKFDEKIVNPLNEKAIGWSKEYTGFKQLQRKIPRSENNGANWDSVAVLFDAGKITHVGTIQNLGFAIGANGYSVEKFKTRLPGEENATENSLHKDHISFTIYEQSPGVPTLYSAMGIASLIPEPNTYVEAESHGNYKFDSDKNEFVLLTEAEKSTYEGTRYSDIDAPYMYNSKTESFEAIKCEEYNKLSDKTPYYSEKGFLWWKNKTVTRFKENPKIYGTPEDLKAHWWQWGLGIITESSPYQVFYIDCNNGIKNNQVNYANDMKALTYFTWGDGNGAWQAHNTLGKSSETYQNNVTYDKNGDIESGKEKAMCYFVKDYMSADSKTGAKYGESVGAYFIFDSVYDNASMNKLTGRTPTSPNETVGGLSDSALPTSGSIFEVSGIHTENAERVRLNTEQIDYFGVAVKVVSFVVELILLFATWGTGSIATKALKEAGEEVVEKGVKKAIKRNIKKFALRAAKYASKAASLGMLILIGSQAVAYTFADAMKSYTNFTKPSALNYGYLSSTYTRSIIYEKDEEGNIKHKNESDSIAYGKNGETYTFYSTTRPQDYHSVKYVGIPIEIENKPSAIPTEMPDSIITSGLHIPENDGDIITQFKDSDFVTHGNVENVTSDGENTSEHIGITADNTYWLLYDKYILEKGQYYINMKCGEIELNRVTLKFKPETKKGFGGVSTDKPCEVPNYVEIGNNIYVHGSFDGTNYSFFTESGKAYQGNTITYDGTTYKLHNTINLASSTVENSETEMKYRLNSEILSHYVKGYDYFDTVYYTAGGQQGIMDNGTELKKYAKFFGKSENVPAGILNLNYVSTSETIELDEADYKYNLSVNGTYRYDETDGKYKLIDNLETFEGNRYIQITTETKTYYYTLDTSTAFSDTEISVSGDAICVEVYPHKFVDPYTDLYTADNTGWQASVSESKTFVYSSDITEGFLTHDPTYYLYEGGYVIDENMLNVVDNKVDGYPTVFVKMEESEYTSTKTWEGGSETTYNSIVVEEITNFDAVVNGSEDFKFGEKKTITYDTLIKEWNSGAIYKKYYSPVHEQPLCLLFYVDDDKNLYRANSSYSLNADGLLARVSVQTRADGNIYENMYLSNAEFALYTRYRYIYNGAKLDFSTIKPNGDKEWKDLNIVPNSPDSTSVNHGSATTLIENVKVVLGGNRDMVLRVSEGDNGKSGSISIV